MFHVKPPLPVHKAGFITGWRNSYYVRTLHCYKFYYIRGIVIYKINREVTSYQIFDKTQHLSIFGRTT